MLTKFPIQKKRAATAAAILVALTGCAVHLPPAPVSHPADASTPESATPPLRPKLLATSRTFVSPPADDRKEKDMSHQDHDMTSMLPNQKPTRAGPAGAAYFTCPMHPEIHEAKPGECPKCGMTLVEKSGAPEGAKP